MQQTRPAPDSSSFDVTAGFTRLPGRRARSLVDALPGHPDRAGGGTGTRAQPVPRLSDLRTRTTTRTLSTTTPRCSGRRAPGRLPPGTHLFPLSAGVPGDGPRPAPNRWWSRRLWRPSGCSSAMTGISRSLYRCGRARCWRSSSIPRHCCAASRSGRSQRKARAYDNHVYVAACNAIGPDAGGHYFGHSMIVSPSRRHWRWGEERGHHHRGGAGPDPLKHVSYGSVSPMIFDHLEDRNLAAYGDILTPARAVASNRLAGLRGEACAGEQPATGQNAKERSSRQHNERGRVVLESPRS